MKNILSPSNRRVLRAFASSNVLLGFDFDGTLAPIVADPERAAMRARTRRLLRVLAGLYPCVVLSGRARADVRGRLRGVPVRGVVGNHGAELRQSSRRLARQVRRWRPLLEERLSALQGVSVEDKGFSTSVHYRRSRRKARARAAILEAVEDLGDVRVIGGACVVNVLPKGAPHKGVAIERERRRLGCETAIYLGDDDTDEDVFAIDRPGRLLTIRVGPRAGSAASYFVRKQADVDELLRLLIAERRAARGIGPAAARRKGSSRPGQGAPLSAPAARSG
ncbi:MAG: trehalose-phosphatase [Acidobacteriota bacterium]